MKALRYFYASSLLGLIAVWASENMFWIALPEGQTAEGLLFVWLAYSLCAASALTAVMLTGVRGFTAVFLAAAVMGWLVEGVIVGEIYLAFPFQLVWTPLAWHALVSGGMVFALGRVVVRWPVMRQVAVWGLLGVFIGFWAQYWPLERNDLPDLTGLLLYLGAMGAVVPLAQTGLDRLGQLMRPRLWVLWVAPAILTALWIAQTVSFPSVIRLSLPVVLMLTLWIMVRLGRGAGPVDFGTQAGQSWRHLLFLLAPLTGALLAVFGWGHGNGFQANVILVLVTVPLSLLIYGMLLVRAIRPKRV